MMMPRWTSKGAWVRDRRWKAPRAVPVATVARVWRGDWGNWGVDELRMVWMRREITEGGMVCPLGGGALAGSDHVRGAAEVQARCLERAFGVPAVDLGELRALEQHAAPAVGELPAEHPAVLAAGGGGATVRGAVGASGGDRGGVGGCGGAATRRRSHTSAA